MVGKVDAKFSMYKRKSVISDLTLPCPLLCHSNSGSSCRGLDKEHIVDAGKDSHEHLSGEHQVSHPPSLFLNFRLIKGRTLNYTLL